MRVRPSAMCVDKGGSPLFPGVRDGRAGGSISINNICTIAFDHIEVWKARDQLRYISSGRLNLNRNTNCILIVLNNEDYWKAQVARSVE